MMASAPAAQVTARDAGTRGWPDVTGRTPEDHTLPSAPIDGFQRALLLEQGVVYDRLAVAPRPVQDKLVPLVRDLYALLRTPLYPKGSCLAFADALMAAAQEQSSVRLLGALASPTAITEVRSMLACAALFRRYGVTPRLTLFLVRWENLVDSEHRTAAARARTFARQVRDVAEAARRAGFADALLPIDVRVDGATGEIVTPLDFGVWSRRVLDAAQRPATASPALLRDVVWSTGFYARQASLSMLGARQALLDLAIRRAIGQRVSAEHAAPRPTESQSVALLTAELHKRFLPCYEASMPIVNLDSRAFAMGAAGVA